MAAEGVGGVLGGGRLVALLGRRGRGGGDGRRGLAVGRLGVLGRKPLGRRHLDALAAEEAADTAGHDPLGLKDHGVLAELGADLEQHLVDGGSGELLHLHDRGLLVGGIGGGS